MTPDTTVFDPRYKLQTRSHRYAIFEGLSGISNGFKGLFSEKSGPVGSVNAGTTALNKIHFPTPLW
jgi:hypothetical protein